MLLCKLFKKSYIVGIFTLILSVTVLPQESSSLEAGNSYKNYFNAYYQINLNYNQNIWQLGEKVSQENCLLSFKHSTLNASLSVFAFTYTDPITIDEFRFRRIGKSYDGWKSLGERPATSYELSQSQTISGYLSIYQKKIYDNASEQDDILIVDYYFITDEKKALSISLKTNLKEWPKLKHEFKTFLASFWIGEGLRPKVLNTSNYDHQWRMNGQGPSHFQSLNQSVSQVKGLNLKWSLNSKELAKDIKDIMSINNYVFLLGKHDLRAISLGNTRLQWKTKVKQETSFLAYEGKRLYFTQRSNSKAELKLIIKDSLTGQTLHQAPLARGVKDLSLSSPIIFGSKVYILLANEMLVFDAKTYKKLYSFSLPSEAKHRIVLSDTQVFIPLQDSIIVLDQNTGAQVSSLPFRFLIQAPIVSEKTLFLISKEESEELHRVELYNLNENKIIWSESILLDNNEVFLNMSHYNNGLILFSQLNSKLQLRIYDHKTGALNFKESFNTKFSFNDQRPYLVYQDAFILLTAENGLSFFIVDLISFEKKSLVFKQDDTQISTINEFILRPQKQGIILYSEDKENKSLRNLDYIINQKK